MLLIIRGFEFNNLNCRWTDNAYASIIWALLILHTIHILTDWGDTIVLWALMDPARLRGAPARRYRRELRSTGATLAPVDPDLPDDLLGAAAVNRESIRDGFMPWAGLALGTTGYFLAHQIGSDSTFQDCAVGSPLIVILGAILGLAVIARGRAWVVGCLRGEREIPARRLIATVSLLACVLFAIGVVLPFIASLIIPRCWA